MAEAPNFSNNRHMKNPVAHKPPHIWVFDHGKRAIGEAERRNHKFLFNGFSSEPSEIKMGLRLAPAPVQELRFMSGSSCDLRSLADRFLRTADPQVLISAQ
ncbi:MAG: hypothetical protein JWQ71_3221 [Pedosphaera sp.]|nr:hypothetical protein [Pedosphaera sp.]